LPKLLLLPFQVPSSKDAVAFAATVDQPTRIANGTNVHTKSPESKDVLFKQPNKASKNKTEMQMDVKLMGGLPEIILAKALSLAQ